MQKDILTLFRPDTWASGNKKIFLLLSVEHEIFFLLINVKMPTVVGISTFISMKIVF